VQLVDVVRVLRSDGRQRKRHGSIGEGASLGGVIRSGPVTSL
jgi:hypothetical protein